VSAGGKIPGGLVAAIIAFWVVATVLAVIVIARRSP
jgi:hypothetical protein